MSMQKAKIENAIYDVIDRKDFATTLEEGNVAVIWNDQLYPKRNKEDSRPGIYSYNWGSVLKSPSKEQSEDYSAANIIDLKSKDTREFINKSRTLREIEREILTNPDNIFTPPLLENDSPEMRALKEAVIAKNIDIDAYEGRFGGNFNNDKRLFSKSSITMGKLKTITDNLDMKVTISIEDKSSDVPNPIGKKIEVEL